MPVGLLRLGTRWEGDTGAGGTLSNKPLQTEGPAPALPKRGMESRHLSRTSIPLGGRANGV